MKRTLKITFFQKKILSFADKYYKNSVIMTEELDIASYMKALTRRLRRGTLCRCDIAIISYTRSCYIYLNNLTILYTTSNYCSRSILCMPGQQFLKETEAYKNFINRIDSGATKNTKGSSP
jgi:hypothetical protein